MDKSIRWVFIVAAGVFIALVGMRMYETYTTQKALEQTFEVINQDLRRSAEASRQRTQALQTQQREQQALQAQKEFEESLACAVNEDSGKCSCYDQRSGLRVEQSNEQCLRYARRN